MVASAQAHRRGCPFVDSRAYPVFAVMFGYA
jgi:hypothetical protein